MTSRLLEETEFGTVKISTFTAETHQELREEIDDLLAQGVKGIVMDLRQNPGGLLTSTVDIASDFLTDGLVTYELNGRNERRTGTSSQTVNSRTFRSSCSWTSIPPVAQRC